MGSLQAELDKLNKEKRELLVYLKELEAKLAADAADEPAIEDKAAVELLLEDAETKIKDVEEQLAASRSSQHNQASHRTPGGSASAVDSVISRADPYQINDVVRAKWSVDKKFYEAKITSVTGPPNNRIYFVKFSGYDDTQKVSESDLIPLNGKKRKAEAAAAAAAANGTAANDGKPAPVQQVNGSTIVSAPAITAQARKEPSKAGDDPEQPPKRIKTVKAKELEKKKAGWQAWQQTKKGSRKGDSMFKTGEGVNARVGFTGSGQAMRKDQDRRRYKFDPTDEQE